VTADGLDGGAARATAGQRAHFLAAGIVECFCAACHNPLAVVATPHPGRGQGNEAVSQKGP
jgi:hypothetical protein